MTSSKIFTALYVINKNAKQFATKARKSYETSEHSTANHNSSKKEALYATKADALSRIHQHADTVEKHTIDGTQYYHFEFEDGENTWKFHIPTSDISIDESIVEDEYTLDQFSVGEYTEGVNMTLKTALQTLNNELNVNANRHLPPSETEWPYLY